MAKNCIYAHLKFHRVPTYPAGNLNQRENPSLNAPGCKAWNMLSNSSHNRPVQGWVLPSPKHLQAWGSPNLSGNPFSYFTTLTATVFSSHLIWIYQVPTCAYCLSSFCSSLGRAGLCLPTVKCNWKKKKKKDLYLQLQKPQIVHIKVDQRGMIQTHKTTYHCKTVFL